ncbi:MAG: hypothetical protein ACXVBL_19110 [Bdellovibrionota bacterium]
METLKERALAWAREDRDIKWRLPLIAYGIFLLQKILFNRDTFTPIDFLDLGIHELGHIAAMPFGQWIGIAGGSAAQLIAPIYGVWQFLRQEDYFAAAFGLAWLAESTHNLSIYIGDARKMELPLANLFGGEPIHDWNYLLESMHLLGLDVKIALLVRGLAFLLCCAYVWIGTWLLWEMLPRGKS